MEIPAFPFCPKVKFRHCEDSFWLCHTVWRDRLSEKMTQTSCALWYSLSSHLCTVASKLVSRILRKVFRPCMLLSSQCFWDAQGLRLPKLLSHSHLSSNLPFSFFFFTFFFIWYCFIAVRLCLLPELCQNWCWHSVFLHQFSLWRDWRLELPPLPCFHWTVAFDLHLVYE